MQGAPGTGKTAVGLHRAAYLLYAHRDQLGPLRACSSSAPTAAFLRYIGDVLPALGEVEPSARPPSRSWSPLPGAAVRGDATRRRAPCSRATPGWPRCCGVPCGRPCSAPTEALVVPRGVAPVAGPGVRGRARSSTSCSRAGVRYDAARTMLPQRLAHAVLLQMEGAGDSPDDRVQDAVARSSRVKKYVDGAVAGARRQGRAASRLLSDPDELAAPPTGLLDRRRAGGSCCGTARPAPRAPPAGRAPTPSCSTRLGDLIDRTPSLGHVVLDEAQDLSPMQLRAVGRRCSTGVG